MSEIRTSYTKEQIAEYLKENNLDVLNNFQIWAKLIEMDADINSAHERIDQMQKVITEITNRDQKPINDIYDKAIGYLKRIRELESKNIVESTANEDHN